MPSGPQLELSGIVTRAAMQIFAHVQARQQQQQHAAERTAKTSAAHLGDISAISRQERSMADARQRWAVSVSSLQIYNEAISDLLAPPDRSGPLQVHVAPPRVRCILQACTRLY